MSKCPAKPGKKCRFHSLRFGGAFCFWCSRIIKRFCVKDGVITEHCHDHNREYHGEETR